MLAPGDPRHGTENGYKNHGCRCESCRQATTDYHRERSHVTGRHKPRIVYLAELRAQLPPHGTESRYVYHRCRCADCKRASRKARAGRRERAAA